MKRIATIQDISCFGKCSITVALPVVSAMGVECCIVPTSILSTHTSGFKGFTFCDVSGELMPIAEHWKKENIELDTVYTGYLGSPEQISLVKKFIETVKTEKTQIFVDPAMADHGRMYPAFDGDFPKYMLELCKTADVLCPNITEAAFLLGKKFLREGEYGEDYISDLARGLASVTNARKIVITGVKYGDGRHGALAYDVNGGEQRYLFSEDQGTSFHGTGDIFSAVLCGALTKGEGLFDATQLAVDFTVECIKRTLPEKDKYFYGVKFEECLGMLTK